MFVTGRRPRYALSPREAKLRMDVDAMVDDAIQPARAGNVLSRAFRSLAGSKATHDVAVELGYSKPAVDAFVRQVESSVNRPAQDAHVSYHSSGIKKVRGRNGVRVVDSKL